MSQKGRTILFSVLFSILFLLISIFLILPTFREIKRTSKEISQTKSKLKEIAQRQEEIEKFKKIFPEIKENLLKFENSFLNKEIPIDFVEFLEKIARDLKVQSQIAILGSSENSISFLIRGAGFPENVFRFIEKVENCNYLIQIEKIRMSKLSEVELKVEEFKEFSKNDLRFEILFSVLAK